MIREKQEPPAFPAAFSIVFFLFVSGCVQPFKADQIRGTNEEPEPAALCTVAASIEPEEAGTVLIEPGGPVERGTNVVVTVSPVSGYGFSHWEGGVSSRSLQVSLTVQEDISLKAVCIRNALTLMVYMSADNELEGDALLDLNELEAVDLSGTGIRVVALLDRAEGYISGDGDWKGVRAYEVLYDPGGINLNLISKRLALEELQLTETGEEELNMGDPLTLSGFISFCKRAYDAECYALVVWGHGSGWRDGTEPREDRRRVLIGSGPLRKQILSGGFSRGVLADDSSSGDMMYTRELRLALEGKGISVIGFDLCFGAMLEIAYEIRGCAKYMVASEDLVPNEGWKYDDVLTRLAGTQKTAFDAATSMFSSFAEKASRIPGATISILDLETIEEVHNSLNRLSRKIYESITDPALKTSVRNTMFSETEDFYTTPGDLNLDIRDLAERMKETYDFADEEAEGLLEATGKTVIREWHETLGNPRAHGLALHFVPLDGNGFPMPHNDAYYKGKQVSNPLLFVEDSDWVPIYPSGPGLLFRLWYELIVE